MRLLAKLSILVLAVAGLSAAAYRPATEYWAERNRPKFDIAKVERGELTEVIKSSGTIQPVLSVHIGSFVSGPIEELYVDFNDEVKKGDLLAEIDPRLYKANVARDRAALATRKADVERIKARLQNAVNDERRSVGLKSDNADFISDTEMDQYRFGRMALEAELLVAEAGIEQAQANLTTSEANLDYTKITSPVDGIVIARMIDPGQTLAAQFQAPELFIVAPDLREEMHIFASVDEADIGQIRKAKETGQVVYFTVYAYPGEIFEGKIYQIRLSSTTTQNVVTYPVVISASNADLKLLPGMTAEISFQVEKKPDVLKIPNGALRFFPKKEHVREADQYIIDGTQPTPDDKDSKSAKPAGRPDKDKSAENGDDPDKKADSDEKKSKSPAGTKRHVWVKDGNLLRAVEVHTGLNDYKFTELVSGELTVEQELVTGVQVEK